MTVSELRFPSASRKLFTGVAMFTGLGLAIVAWGVVVILFNPLSWTGVLFWISGAYVAGMGLMLIALVWLFLGVGTVTTWRRWRQFFQPPVVIDESGACYRPRRGPVLIPWTDVEQLDVERTILPKSVVTKVSVRLAPDAAALRDGVVSVSDSRNLDVGMLRDLNTPEDTAMRYLEEAAGPLLKITNDDRRRPARDRYR